MSVQDSSHEESDGRPRRRPVVVSVAGWLLLLAVPAMALYSIPPLRYADQIIDVYRDIYAGTAAESFVADLSATPQRVASMALLAVAGLLAVLAVLVLRGNRIARVITWLLAGLVVCSGVPQLLLEPQAPPRPPGTPPAAEVERMLAEVMPGWVEPASWAGLGWTVVALLAAMVLLGLPRANDYFRKPAPVSEQPPPLHPS